MITTSSLIKHTTKENYINNPQTRNSLDSEKKNNYQKKTTRIIPKQSSRVDRQTINNDHIFHMKINLYEKKVNFIWFHSTHIL